MTSKRSVSILVLIGLVLLGLACASAEPTPTPVPPAQPAAPVAPVGVPQPTVMVVPGAPTPIPARPTPKSALPIPTPVAIGKPQYGGTLRLALTLDLDNLDPAFTSQPFTQPVLYNLYEGLFETDSAAKVLPLLGQSWEISADGKTITVRLQNGVKFHDGSPFDAHAFKWNLDRMMDLDQSSPRRAELLPYLEAVEAVNADTVKIRLHNPSRPFVPLLASERLGMVASPAAVEKYGGGREGNYGRNPVGTGPFRFDKWIPGESVSLTRNKEYWQKGKPYLDGILIQSVLEPSVKIAMLRTGETDYIAPTDVSGYDLPILQRNPDIKVTPFEGSSILFLTLNTKIPPFDNKALRQAISYAMDRDIIVKNVLGGLGTTGYTLLSGGWAYNPDLKPIVFDLAKAKQKLSEAGYPQGVTVPIGCPATNNLYSQTCEVAQALAGDAGIKLDIKLVNYQIYFSMQQGYIASPGFGAVSWGIRADPHVLHSFVAHSKGFYNLGIYVNPEVDRLIEEAATTYDIAKAKPIYDRIQTVVAEEAALIFLARTSYNFTMTKRLQGFTPLIPVTKPYFGNAWLEK